MYCPHCGNGLSHLGGQCPHCGRDIATSPLVSKRRIWPWVLLTIIILGLVMFGSCAYVVSSTVEDLNDPATLLGKIKAEDDYMFNTISGLMLQQLTPEVDAMMSALLSGDVPTAYEHTHADFKDATSLEDFEQYVRAAGLDSMTGFDIDTFTYTADADPYITVTVYFPEAEEEYFYLRMVMTDDLWQAASMEYD